MLARCPSCRNTFTAERTGRQDCPVCGKPLVVPEAPPPAPPPAMEAAASSALPPPEPPHEAEAAGTPWERRSELGFFAAWLQTLSQALFDPGKLFASARLDKGWAQLGFAVLTGSAFWAVEQVLERVLLGGRREQLQQMLMKLQETRPFPPFLLKMIQSSNSNSVAQTALYALLVTPVFMVVFVYVSAAVTHLFALLFGQNRRGFPATFAAVAYAFAPLALMAIPGCGWLIALVWTVVLTGVGMKAMHRISSGGAVATALGPYLFFCCALCGLASVLGVLFAQVAASGKLPQ